MNTVGQPEGWSACELPGLMHREMESLGVSGYTALRSLCEIGVRLDAGQLSHSLRVRDAYVCQATSMVRHYNVENILFSLTEDCHSPIDEADVERRQPTWTHGHLGNHEGPGEGRRTGLLSPSSCRGIRPSSESIL